ncbi:ComEA family DNA-binding protein [Cobetia sp. QF-1]|uniref:ComEA family DNA-binding protein n=1 Tax=Cobetia sp. QF-1 TaxID=1969833 RepID=UPI000B53F630|nr:ComEA family DNA-binding protein [Cobetia sp. QF-1]
MKTVLGTLVVAGLMAFSSLSQAAELNINTANLEQLVQLKGIGDKKAAAIVAWREANGPFTTVEQLADVKGISTNTLQRMDTTLTLGKTTKVSSANASTAAIPSTAMSKTTDQQAATSEALTKVVANES